MASSVHGKCVGWGNMLYERAWFMSKYGVLAMMFDRQVAACVRVWTQSAVWCPGAKGVYTSYRQVWLSVEHG